MNVGWLVGLVGWLVGCNNHELFVFDHGWLEDHPI